MRKSAKNALKIITIINGLLFGINKRRPAGAHNRILTINLNIVLQNGKNSILFIEALWKYEKTIAPKIPPKLPVAAITFKRASLHDFEFSVKSLSFKCHFNTIASFHDSGSSNVYMLIR